jgi:hypothetical protein
MRNILRQSENAASDLRMQHDDDVTKEPQPVTY